MNIIWAPKICDLIICLLFLQYIQHCVANDARPQLMLMQKCDIEIEDRIRGSTIVGQAPPLPPKPERSTISLWDIGPQSLVKIKIVCATNINSPGLQVLNLLLNFLIQ